MIVTRGLGGGTIVTNGLGLLSLIATIVAYINKTHKRIITTLLR